MNIKMSRSRNRKNKQQHNSYHEERKQVLGLDSLAKRQIQNEHDLEPLASVPTVQTWGF